ncbi:MAG: DNA double-strand break repair nuclease NurA [Anaerolineae bacterium]|nr:DNA double-strand break repair nuclease NurA [Anaerolineae bacterium]
MTLEFEKVVEQVARMGRALAARSDSLSERSALAWERLALLSDVDAVRERVVLARVRDAGFRGAALLDEPANRAYPLPSLPPHATLLAADGSQVYPNPHGAALYYLINVGVFVYHHGTDALPEQITEPQLQYSETALHNTNGQLITNAVVNARRSVQELALLAREAWARAERAGPLLAISDGPLLFWMDKDVPDRKQLEDEYLGWLINLHDLHANRSARGESASLLGYVDRPASAFLIGLLHLMGLDEAEVRAPALKSNGDLEGLADQALLLRLLKPGERSALLVQQSPRNKDYHDKGERYEIACFYLNVSSEPPYHLARVEMPMWVAGDPALVDAAHALVYDQCQLMWRYPYALTRADELAVVRNQERAQLNELIEIELRRHAQEIAHSEKLDSKVVRHGRTRYGQGRQK